MTSVGAPRDIVCVVGMHRSGTSLCANILHEMGIDMADEAGASPHNPRGHWERARINDLHDEVFATFDRSWGSAAHVLSLPPHWLDHPKIGAIRDALITYVAPKLGTGRWGIKDPRMARLLPLWRLVFVALDAAPRFVLCVRNPAQVARSLEARDRFLHDQAEYRWLAYNADAVTGIGAEPVCVVPYDAWFHDAAGTARRLAHAVGGTAPAEDRLRSLIDPVLRHDAAGATAHACAARLYRALAACTDRLTADARALALCASEFAEQVQPLLVEAETLRAGIAAQNRVIRDLNEMVAQLRRRTAA